LPDELRSNGIEGQFVFADLPGSGAHSRVRTPASVPAIVDFVRDDLRARGYASPYRLIALSLGAMVALAWAQRAPREIESLVLINTSMRSLSAPFMRLRPRALPELLCAALRWRNRRDAEAAIHNLTCNRRDERDADLAAWIAIYRSAPVDRATVWRQFRAAACFKAHDAPPQCPTLLLSSRGDALVNPDCSAALSHAWGAAHRQHRWAGHDLPHDDPAWLADSVARWVAKLGKEATSSGGG
jgi:pimeloyl-ACP methyl ester carboxylesterase